MNIIGANVPIIMSLIVAHNAFENVKYLVKAAVQYKVFSSLENTIVTLLSHVLSTCCPKSETIRTFIYIKTYIYH